MMLLATLARRHGWLKVRHVLRRFYDWRVVVERLVSDAQLHGLALCANTLLRLITVREEQAVELVRD